VTRARGDHENDLGDHDLHELLAIATDTPLVILLALETVCETPTGTLDRSLVGALDALSRARAVIAIISCNGPRLWWYDALTGWREELWCDGALSRSQLVARLTSLTSASHVVALDIDEPLVASLGAKRHFALRAVPLGALLRRLLATRIS
jgi:hypothetical protein